LIFGLDFDQEVAEAIPDSVTHLTLGFFFNRNIIGVIPNTVKYLNLGSRKLEYPSEYHQKSKSFQ